uniref:Uncharacterized protein n=1 Tax=Setaria digitata TaxID=48799 RepID=A0A915PX24_9BILA
MTLQRGCKGENLKTKFLMIAKFIRKKAEPKATVPAQRKRRLPSELDSKPHEPAAIALDCTLGK